MIFSLVDPSHIVFQPGQYILLNVEGGFRQYSIVSTPKNDQVFEILIDVFPMGIGSKYLLKLQPKDIITFRAPLGLFILSKKEVPKIFLGTGSGIAPLKSMIQELIEDQFSKPMYLMWGLRTAKDMYYQNEIKELAQRNTNFHYAYCLSREQNLPNTHLMVESKIISDHLLIQHSLVKVNIICVDVHKLSIHCLHF